MLRSVTQPKSLAELMLAKDQKQGASEAPELGAMLQAQSWTYADPYHNKHGVRVVLECLRELAALCLPCQAMADSGLAETVRLFVAHPHPAVASLASQVLGRWQRRVLAAAAVLADPLYGQDPTAHLEAALRSSDSRAAAQHQTGTPSGATEELLALKSQNNDGAATGGDDAMEEALQSF